jgi:nucleoside 2-deoxyribosyltransferase
MQTCFVMQPFDGDKFDRRYTDVFEPAIQEAGLKPYRVDRDPEVTIPIDEIERRIRDSDICFAEITLDNPNVWFELGYASALSKPICMVCSKTERITPFPFDVRHRMILQYDTRSTSDFESLKTAITRKLKSLIEQSNRSKSISSLSTALPTDGLTPHEVMAISIIGTAPDHDPIAHHSFCSAMEQAGFTELAANLALRSLLKSRMVIRTSIESYNGDTYEGYLPDETGINWLMNHQDKLQLKLASKKSQPQSNEDIPF